MMRIDAYDDDSTDVEGWGRCLLILIAITLHTAALFSVRPLQSANDRSRWCTVWSLVERGTFRIDEIRQVRGWDSIDIIQDEGHYYSTKPPLLSVIVAGITWCVQRATGWTLLNQTQLVTGFVLLFVNILPFAASLFLISRLLERIAATGWCRLFVLSAAAFGTLVTPFLMTLNNHTVAVVGVVISLFALERILNLDEPPGWAFALCGGGSAWAACHELPAASLGLATLVIALRCSPSLTLRWYLPAAIIPLVGFMVTNVVATGSWKPTYAGYGSSKYNFVVDGIPSYWMEPHGVDRNLDSPLMYFVHCTIGHHGMLSLTPIFLLSLFGWIASGSVRNPYLRAVIRLGAMLTIVNLGFFMTRTQNYNFGGVSCGLRWANWLIPFWLLALVPVMDFIVRSATLRTVASVLLVGSMVSAWIPINNPWQQPWLFHAMENWGWIDYRDKPSALPRTLWTWFPSVPSSSTEQESAAWVEFTSNRPDGGVARRRMVLGPSTKSDSDRIVEVLVQETRRAEKWDETRKFLINVTQFDAGAAAADFMQWSDPNITEEQQQSDLTFVRGLPLKRDYRPGKIHYLKTGLRRDAFRCQFAAAAVDSTSEGGRVLRYRCDVWLCDELPFGVAKIEYQISDPVTKATLHQEEWTVSDCHPKVATTAPQILRHP